MSKILIFLSLLGYTGASLVSQEAAALAESTCVGVKDLSSIDPAEADVVTAFVGTTNYIEAVWSYSCACVMFSSSERLFTTLSAVI